MAGWLSGYGGGLQILYSRVRFSPLPPFFSTLHIIIQYDFELCFCRDGGTGRRKGLKIPRRLPSCGFDSRSRHHIRVLESLYTLCLQAFFLPFFWQGNINNRPHMFFRFTPNFAAMRLRPSLYFCQAQAPTLRQ